MNRKVQEALDELDQPHDFGEYFRRNFDCEDRKGSLICEIDGESMKVQNSVRNSEYNEGNEKGMIKAVVENHQVNKKAGITY